MIYFVYALLNNESPIVPNNTDIQFGIHRYGNWAMGVTTKIEYLSFIPQYAPVILTDDQAWAFKHLGLSQYEEVTYDDPDIQIPVSTFRAFTAEEQAKIDSLNALLAKFKAQREVEELVGNYGDQIADVSKMLEIVLYLIARVANNKITNKEKNLLNKYLTDANAGTIKTRLKKQDMAELFDKVIAKYSSIIEKLYP